MSEPLAPTSESAAATIAADAPTTADSTPTDNPATTLDPTPVAAGSTVEAAAAVTAVTAAEPALPPRPKKKRRWLRAIGGVAAAAVIVTMTGATGYVADHHHVHNGVYPEPASSYTSPASAKPSESADRKPRNHAGDLRKFLLSKPSSAERLIDTEAPNGTMTLSQMAYYFDNRKRGAEYLKESGYKIGATTIWKDKAGNIVVIRLSRFSTDNQAYSYYRNQVSTVADAKDTKNTKPTTVNRVPFQAATVFSGGRAKHGMIIGKGIGYLGDVMIEIWVNQKAPESPDLIAGLLYQQWNRL